MTSRSTTTASVVSNREILHRLQLKASNMPALTPNSGSLVLVTGASGFIGTHTVTELLNTGFKVRATVRSIEKGDYLTGLYPGKEIEYAVVPDMNKPGAYDEAVTGIDAVIHVASPVDLFNEGDPSLVIEPAVKGTLGILSSLHKFAPDVKRIVNVGSIAAVTSLDGGPKYITEKDWHDAAVDTVTKLGKDAPTPVKYYASKVVAERAFWDFFKTKQPTFDGVVTLPGSVFGPATQFANELSGAEQMMEPWLKGPMPESQLDTAFYNLVHVSDVARANVRALVVPEAGGERFLVNAEQLFANDVLLAAEKFPELKDQNLTKGNPDKGFRDDIVSRAVHFDASKSVKVLGIKYKDRFEALPESIKNAIPIILGQKA